MRQEQDVKKPVPEGAGFFVEWLRSISAKWVGWELLVILRGCLKEVLWSLEL